MQPDIFVAPLELKFAQDGALGEFSGYAAVFGSQDGHGDVIMPGAFSSSLAERKAQGRQLPMHVMHGVFGGDGLPVGVWKNVQEDDKGLKVEGKISGMNTDAGRLLFERVKDGALGGLSIGYRVKRNGATYGDKPGEPKRVLKNLHLAEISLVDDPSHAAARVNELKAMARNFKVATAGGPGDPDDLDEETFAGPDVEDAVEAVAAAIIMFDKMMQSYAGYYGGNVKDSALLMDRLRDAHEALTGDRAPDGVDGWTKAMPPIRAIEKKLREEFRLPHTKARAIAERWFKSLPREEGRTQAIPHGHAAIGEFGAALAGFKLP